MNDATAVAAILRNRFQFSADKVTLLVDAEATRSAILDSYLSFTEELVDVDERLLVFFAGHGHTVTGSRGEVGYLVPVDGKTNKLSTLIRWDELTRSVDLIKSKHVLFVMDACYGGLAISRALPAGSMRFLRDMLLRPVRQVLTAGKANEVVADSGGPIAGHSIFTGHFLEALGGKASSADGVITANGVMAYVYEKVARDQHSNQTPHYGFLDGDGDFVFAAPVLQDSAADEQTKDEDSVIVVPSAAPETGSDTVSDIDRVKEHLADPRHRIKLDDLVAQKTRELIPAVTSPDFSTDAPVSVADIPVRLRKYEDVAELMRAFVTVISYWGQKEHQPTLRKPFARLCDQLTVQAGSVAWVGLRWYPLDLLFSAGVIAALAASRFEALVSLMLGTVPSPASRGQSIPLVVAVEDGLMDAHRSNVFKGIPGHERNFAPKSEYLFKVLQPQLDDLLFLGQDYEDLFDGMEILRALVYADDRLESGGRLWGPVGRFGWKFTNRQGTDPYSRMLEDAVRQGAAWGPVAAGLFRGDIARFRTVAERYRDELLAKLQWF